MLRYLVLPFFAFPLLSQAQVSYFNRLYDENDTWQGFAAAVENKDNPSSFLLVGINIGFSISINYIWNCTINPEGDTIANARITAGDKSAYYIGFQSTIPGTPGYFIAGTWEQYVDQVQFADGYLMRLDQTGNRIWEKKYGGAKFDAFDAMIMDKEKNLVMAGISYNFNDTTEGDIYVVKTDTTGEVIWQKSWGTNNFPERCWGIDTTSDGGYILAGSQGFDTQESVFVIKIDSLGNQLWKKNFSGKRIPHIKTLQNGDFLLTTGAPVNGSIDHAKIARISPAGNILWLKHFPGKEWHAWFSYPAELNDGALVNAGGEMEFDSTNGNYWVLGTLTKTDAQGNLIWKRQYYTRHDLDNYFFGMIPTSDLGFLMYGFAYRDSNNRQDAWAVKVDSLGCLEPGCDGSVAAPEAEATAVALNIYPNPVAERFTVETPDEPMLGLRLCDLSGRVLDDVQFFRQYPVRQYSLSLAGQPPGVYVLSVRTNKGWVGRKVVKQ